MRGPARDAAVLRCRRRIRAVVANRDNRFFEIDETLDGSSTSVPRRSECRCGSWLKDRIKRILREDVLDVRDQQFLMLLLVMKTEHEYRFDFSEQLVVRLGK